MNFITLLSPYSFSLQTIPAYSFTSLKPISSENKDVSQLPSLPPGKTEELSHKDESVVGVYILLGIIFGMMVMGMFHLLKDRVREALCVQITDIERGVIDSDAPPGYSDVADPSSQNDHPPSYEDCVETSLWMLPPTESQRTASEG